MGSTLDRIRQDEIEELWAKQMEALNESPNKIKKLVKVGKLDPKVIDEIDDNLKYLKNNLHTSKEGWQRFDDLVDRLNIILDTMRNIR